MSSQWTEEMWLTPSEARRELENRGYEDIHMSDIESSHEEVALSLIAQSIVEHDLIGLVRLLREAEPIDNRGNL